MGILNSLENSAAFKSALGQLEGAVLPVVLNEVLGSGGQGGLSAIVAKLQQAGFGDQVKSWIGNGANLPITAEQLQEVLGSDTVKQLGARFNIPVDQLGPDPGAATAQGGGRREPERQPPVVVLGGRTGAPGAGRWVLREPEKVIIALKNLQIRVLAMPRCNWPSEPAPC